MVNKRIFFIEKNLIDLGLTMHDAEYFFQAVREGDVVTFATSEENERHGWVQALYRATGQSHKPTPPMTATTKSSQGNTTAGQKDQLGLSTRERRKKN